MWKSLVCVTLLFVTGVVVCNPDYLFDQDVNGWLKLHVVPAKWQEAFLNCYYEGAVLASPINADLATALSSIMNQSKLDSDFFLGVHAFTQGDFISIEGVPLTDLSITWGKSNSSSKVPEDCLSLSSNEKTYKTSCTLALPYICYKKRDNSTVLNQCGTFDDDYRYYHATGSCYKHHKKQTWRKGHKICAAEGGHLVIINDKQEADIIMGLLDPPSGENWGEPVHIGLRDWNKDHTWLSIHGEKIEDLFHTWSEGQPDHKGVYLCGLFWAQGTLDDVHCDHPLAEYAFICEKDPTTLLFENISSEVYDVITKGNSCDTVVVT